MTLGGGIGHLMRRFGLTIDNLLACDLVTADGEFLVASEDEHPELFWALRGGGGNFGIVTCFKYRLHPVGPAVLAGLVAWPMTEAAEVLRFSATSSPTHQRRWGLWPTCGWLRPLPIFPDDLHGRPIVGLIVCYVGPIEEGEKVLRPLREFKTPILDAVGSKPYLAHQAMFDPAYPHGRHYYWKSWRLPPLSDAAIDVIVEQATAITSPLSAIPIFTLGGAVARGRGRRHSLHRPERCA